MNTPNLNSTQISVQTYKGVVQLSGFVDSADQVQLAGQAASSVAGVTNVENSLVVRSDISSS